MREKEWMSKNRRAGMEGEGRGREKECILYVLNVQVFIASE